MCASERLYHSQSRECGFGGLPGKRSGEPTLVAYRASHKSYVLAFLDLVDSLQNTFIAPRPHDASSRPTSPTFRSRPTAADGEWPLLGCAVKRRRFPVGESPTRLNAPAGCNRSNCGGNETVEAFGETATKYGGGARVQAVTRVNAEQSSKRTMRRSTRLLNRGRLTRLGDRAKTIPVAAPG